MPKPNRKEHCKAIQLRSGKEVTIPVEQDDGKDVSKTKDKLIPEVESHVEETFTKTAPDATKSAKSTVGQPLPKLIPERPPPPFP